MVLNRNILAEISKGRNKDTAPFVDKRLIKVALDQFINMNYGNEVKLTKKAGTSEIIWNGKKELETYRNHFEVPLIE